MIIDLDRYSKVSFLAREHDLSYLVILIVIIKIVFPFKMSRFEAKSNYNISLPEAILNLIIIKINYNSENIA
jgi:hypothetical protein